MTKLIDKLMPYRVVAEGKTIPLNKNYTLNLKGFTKRFAKEERLETYLKKRLQDETFNWNYTVENNTYYVSPGKFAIAKAIQGVI